MSLRWRITLGLGVIAALGVLIGATAAYITTSQRLATTLDDSLRTAAARLPGVRQPDGNTPPGGHDESPHDGGDFSRPQGCPPAATSPLRPPRSDSTPTAR